MPITKHDVDCPIAKKKIARSGKSTIEIWFCGYTGHACHCDSLTPDQCSFLKDYLNEDGKTED